MTPTVRLVACLPLLAPLACGAADRDPPKPVPSMRIAPAAPETATPPPVSQPEEAPTDSNETPAIDMEGARALGRNLLRAVGLGTNRKVEECNALIQVINTGVQNLEQGGKFTGDASGVRELRNMADAMDKVAAEAAKVKLTLPELRTHAAEYQAMAKAVARAARDMASGAQAKDANRINQAQSAMEAAVKIEDPLVDSINKFCQAP